MRIGIDLGGTKISGIVLDSAGNQQAYERMATPVGDYHETLQAIADLVVQLEQQTEVAHSIGIGTPGALSPSTGLMRNSNSTCLNGLPLKQDIETRLGRTIQMSNDADCFALSEASDGAARGANTVFGVILGTGVGGGLVINGQLVNGANAIAGEWGHNPLPWQTSDEYPGLPCYCGKLGCIETFLSGPGMQKHYFNITGKKLTVGEIIKQSAINPDAKKSLQQYVDRLARSLAGVINIVDPEVIVLGGGLSNIDVLYEEVPLRWGKYVFSDVVTTKLVKNQFGDDSGVRGAARLNSRQ
jgi:fructokinase